MKIFAACVISLICLSSPVLSQSYQDGRANLPGDQRSDAEIRQENEAEMGWLKSYAKTHNACIDNNTHSASCDKAALYSELCLKKIESNKAELRRRDQLRREWHERTRAQNTYENHNYDHSDARTPVDRCTSGDWIQNSSCRRTAR